MRKLAIIHFNPIELYPPVMNWLNFLSRQDLQNLKVSVFTTHASTDFKKFESTAINIVRVGKLYHRFSLLRYWNYFKFYVSSTVRLITMRADSILYYETLSSFPAYFYKKLISPKSRLFIHYHEYTTADEYNQGMMLARWQHGLEKKIYPQAVWISQTNEDRMNLFLIDNKNVARENTFILPNYPPSSWRREDKIKMDLPLKTVYIGALSLDTMYTKEFFDWIISQNGQITCDIYSSNITGDAKKYLQSLDPSVIRFHGAVDYFSLPDELRKYDVGVILYKGHISNYIYNQPNKLFEYLACGLDVWLPKIMTSALSFITYSAFPSVKAIDFQNINSFDWHSAIDRTNSVYKPFSFYSENVLGKLYHKLVEKEEITG